MGKSITALSIQPQRTVNSYPWATNIDPKFMLTFMLQRIASKEQREQRQEHEAEHEVVNGVQEL